MIYKLGKLQQKVIIILSDTKQLDILELSEIINMYPSETKRILQRMEKKKIIKFKKNNRVTINNNQDIKKDLSNQKQLQLFYSSTRNSKTFDNKLDHILIQADNFFINIFHNSIEDNETLEQLKEINKNQYKIIVEGLKTSLKNQVQGLKNKILAWSENRYKIIFDGNKIKLIDNRFNITAILENFDKTQDKTNYQNLSEIIEILSNSIKELNEFCISISDHDYLNF